MRKGAPLAVVPIARAAVVAAMSGRNASSEGKDRAAPKPRKKFRREVNVSYVDFTAQ